MPPSTTRAEPVMKLESSDAKNSAAFAISSACPNRPIGMWTSLRSRLCRSASSSASSGVSIGPGHIEFALIPAPRHLDGKLTGEREHSTFGRRVGDLGGCRTHESDEGGDVHDRASAGRLESGKPGAAAEPHPLQVHPHHSVPDLGRGVSVTPPSSPGKMPAQLNITWSPPKAIVAVSTMSATCVLVGHVDLDRLGPACPPAMIDSAVDSADHHRRCRLRRPLRPLQRRARHATRPMPLPEPVTIATFPSRRPVTRRNTIGDGRCDHRCVHRGDACATTGCDHRCEQCDLGPRDIRRVILAECRVRERVPLVGLTTYRQQATWGSWQRRAALLQVAYVDCVSEAGGRPVMLPPAEGPGGSPGSRRRLGR